MNLILHVVRGQHVILDSDLAKLYNVETGNFNKAIKRNANRFPERFRFQLTKEEYENLRFQNGISSANGHGGRRYLPYAFTEHGSIAASYVLNSPIAVEMSVRITDEFIAMRKMIASNMHMLPPSVYQDIKTLQEGHAELKTTQTELENTVQQILDYISDSEIDAQKLFFAGQTYDAFAFFLRMVEAANSSIVLIDGYTDARTLNILAKKKDGVNVTMYSFANHKPTDHDINMFNSQYPALTVKTMCSSHDRYLVLDDMVAYHIGASLKDAGKKSFAITRLEDIDSVRRLIARLDSEENA